MSSTIFTAYEKEIERRQWHSLLDEPPLGCVNLVREFYANLMVVSRGNQLEGHVWVRGHWVDVHPSSINTFQYTLDI